jgi:hypothetical protein
MRVVYIILGERKKTGAPPPPPRMPNSIVDPNVSFPDPALDPTFKRVPELVPDLDSVFLKKTSGFCADYSPVGLWFKSLKLAY